METWKVFTLGAVGVGLSLLLAKKAAPTVRTLAVQAFSPATPQADGSWPASTRPYNWLNYNSDRVNVTGLHRAVLPRFLGMANEYLKLTNKKLQVNSGLRSSAYQKLIYDRDVRSSTTPTGQPKKVGVPSGYVAKPMSSPHERGLAIDVNSSQATELDKLGLLRKYGFDRPLWPKGRAKVTEEWHLQIRPEVIAKVA